MSYVNHTKTSILYHKILVSYPEKTIEQQYFDILLSIFQILNTKVNFEIIKLGNENHKIGIKSGITELDISKIIKNEAIILKNKIKNNKKSDFNKDNIDTDFVLETILEQDIILSQLYLGQGVFLTFFEYTKSFQLIENNGLKNRIKFKIVSNFINYINVFVKNNLNKKYEIIFVIDSLDNIEILEEYLGDFHYKYSFLAMNTIQSDINKDFVSLQKNIIVNLSDNIQNDFLLNFIANLIKIEKPIHHSVKIGKSITLESMNSYDAVMNTFSSLFSIVHILSYIDNDNVNTFISSVYDYVDLLINDKLQNINAECLKNIIKTSAKYSLSTNKHSSQCIKIPKYEKTYINDNKASHFDDNDIVYLNHFYEDYVKNIASKYKNTDLILNDKKYILYKIISNGVEVYPNIAFWDMKFDNFAILFQEKLN